MLTQENQQLTMQNKDLASALEAEKAERQRLEQNGATAAANTNPAATTEATNTQPLPTNLPAGVSAEWQGTELVLIIEGDVLFDSGKTSLKNNAMTTVWAATAAQKTAVPFTCFRKNATMKTPSSAG